MIAASESLLVGGAGAGLGTVALQLGQVRCSAGGQTSSAAIKLLLVGVHGTWFEH